MLPKVFDPPLTHSQIEAAIAELNSSIFATKQAMIRQWGSWTIAQRKGDMKPYRDLLADRKAYRNLLIVTK